MQNSIINFEKIQSATITWLRWPLMVLVVLLHTVIIGQTYENINISGIHFSTLDIVTHVFQRDIGDIAVPAFFFFSGYLFFYKVQGFSIEIYRCKLKKRFFSLLLPYIIWNFLFMCFLLAISALDPSMMHFATDYSEHFNVRTFFLSFWDINGGPILAPFWFVRNLMILNILSPIIYFIIEKFSLIFMLFSLLIIYLLGIYLPSLDLVCLSLFFYSLGAFMSINKLNFVQLLYPYRIYIGILYLFLLVLDTWLWGIGDSYKGLHKLIILVGLFAFIQIVGIGICNKFLHVHIIFSESSFFAFAFHMFFVNFFNKFWVKVLPLNEFSAIIAQLLIPMIVGGICTVIYYILKKNMPKLSSYLIGGR